MSSAPAEDPYMSGNTTSGEVTPRTASARVDGRRSGGTSLTDVQRPSPPPPPHRVVTSRLSPDRSPGPRAVPRPVAGLGRPPIQKNPAQLSIEHERLRGPGEGEDEDEDLIVVDFTPSKESAPARGAAKTPATALSSPSGQRLAAKDEAAKEMNFPSWKERRPSQVRGGRAPSSASARLSSVQSRGLSPSSQRASLIVDEQRERDEQQRKFRIVRNLFASHEDGLRFCIILDQLLAARAIASQEFEARLLLLPKHEAAKLKAMKEKEDGRRRAREDRIWDVENVVRRAVPTEPPAMLAKLFNKGTGTDASPETAEKPSAAATAAAAAAEKRKAAEAEHQAQKDKDALAHKVAALEAALQDAKNDNDQLKKDLATAQEKNREADLVQSTRPTLNPRGGSAAPSPSSCARSNGDADLWAAIDELRRAVSSLNQRVGSIEQREQMSMLDAIGQLRRDLQQLDQRAALMEGRQRAALGWQQ